MEGSLEVLQFHFLNSCELKKELLKPFGGLEEFGASLSELFIIFIHVMTE